MRNTIFVSVILCFVSIRTSFSVPVGENAVETAESRPVRTSNKMSEELRLKLEKLKKVLDEVDLAKSVETTEAPTRTPEKADDNSEQKSEETGQSEDEKLSRQDLLLLRSLEAIVRGDTHNEDRQQDNGVFLEKPVRIIDHEARDTPTDENLNKLKRTEHDRFYLQDPGNSNRLPQDGIPAKRQNGNSGTETKDGSFGDFQDDVMENDVNRLLNDLSIALKHGFTVEDVIRYLYGTEQAIKHKQKRIQDEEQQLQSLLRRQKERD